MSHNADNGTNSANVKLLPTPIQGDADWRSFRSVQLDNGVTAVLVHDPQSKTTSAAATVNAGASSDPRHLSGLAHFCEHMVFLGSQKYPGENQYKSYLAQHGGRSNASTSMHLTTFKFEILADYAEAALDMFGNFFVAPLFTQSGTGREVHAVDSENSKNLTSDFRRRWQILKDLGDPEHYYTKFSTGNSKTLSTKTPEELQAVRQALLAFHKYHYRPENLVVVVAGPQSLDQLQEWVAPQFQNMKGRDLANNPSSTTELEQSIAQAARDAPPYGFGAPLPPPRSAFRPEIQGGTWPFVYTVKPLQSMRKMVLMFPLPPVQHIPDQSPVSMLSHLLGHEGPQSPFAVLQNEGWVSSLSTGARVSAPDFSMLQIDVGLTERGETMWQHVAAVLFAHCRLIAEATVRHPDLLSRIWGEKVKLNQLFFHQTAPGGVYSLAPNLSSNVALFGTAKCLSSGSMLEEDESTFPLKDVAEFAKRLVPSNCFIERCSEKAWEEAVEHGMEKRSEKWYGVDYMVSSDIDKNDSDCWEGKLPTLEHLTNQLALPRENLYIPRSLELCPELPEEARQGPRIDKPIDPPNLVVDDPKLGRLWHRLDDRYALPKSYIAVLVRNALVENKPADGSWEYDSRHSVHSSLIASMFREALAQETYDADLAGLSWGMSMSSDGVKFVCRGFSDRLADLALRVLREFFSSDFLKESHFLSSKDRMLRNLRTYFESRRADSHAMYYRDFLIESESAGLELAIKAGEATTLDSIKEHYQLLLNNKETLLDCLYTGNVSKNDAESFFTKTTDILLEKTAIGELSHKSDIWMGGSVERRLDKDVELHFATENKQEENGAVVVTYQSPTPGFRGPELSDEKSLQSSSAIRLLCHMLREPLFDELRTKQTLGYIVGSYYDVGISSAPPSDGLNKRWKVPVDYIVMYVLSRKACPTDIVERMDDFLGAFRQSLVKMPASEIQDHASALSTKLLKPIQNLSQEAGNQFSKILRFAPQVLEENECDSASLPWDNSQVVAATIQSLNRHDLLKAWDAMMLPHTRSRVVSCVYGSTFPLVGNQTQPSPHVIVNDLPKVIAFRNKLALYDNAPSIKGGGGWMWLGRRNRRMVVGAMVATGMIGLGLTVWSRTKKTASK